METIKSEYSNRKRVHIFIDLNPISEWCAIYVCHERILNIDLCLN